MKQPIFLFRTGIHLALISLFMGLFTLGIAQENQDSKPQEELQEEPLISLEDMPAKIEDINRRLLNMRTVLDQNSRILEIDSLIDKFGPEMSLRKESLFDSIESMSLRELEFREVGWSDYRVRLNAYQDDVKKRIEDVGEISFELKNELKTWTRTKEELGREQLTAEVFGSIEEVQTSLKEMSEATMEELNFAFSVQAKLTDVNLTFDTVLEELSRRSMRSHQNYFVFDSSPIWSIGSGRTIGVDRREAKSARPPREKAKISSIVRQIKSFYELNRLSLIFQVIFIAGVFTALVAIRKKWKPTASLTTDDAEDRVSFILNHPLSVTVILGFLISSFFYDSLIPVLREIHVLIIFAATILLLAKLTDLERMRYLTILLLVALVNFIQPLLHNEILSRLVLMLSSIFLFIAVYNIRNHTLDKADLSVRSLRFYRIVLFVYLLLCLVAVFSAVLGLVNLASLLTEGVLFSMMLGMVIYVAVRILTSLGILLFQIRKPYNIKALASLLDVTNKRIQPLLNILGFVLWIYFTLSAFEIKRLLLNWLDNLMQIQWVAGEMTLSVGGILSFLVIFFVSILIANLVGRVMRDPWIVQKLPRGAATGVSMISRILILSFGVYVGFSIAGLDMSNFGYILGALSVGIGFGLQGVVLNFVAGLILAFERPINIGDAIQIDDEFGVVSNIGGRTSNIRSWSGQEVIIPNGDLISKKVINWTLNNRDRRGQLLIRTMPGVHPEKIVEVLNSIANDHENTYEFPRPKTYFKGFKEDGTLLFQLWYWSDFSDGLQVDHDINMKIFNSLRELGIEAPAPVHRIIS